MSLAPFYVHPRAPKQYAHSQHPPSSPSREQTAEGSMAYLNARRYALEAGRNFPCDSFSPEFHASRTIGKEREAKIREDVDRALHYQRRAQARKCALSTSSSPSYNVPSLTYSSSSLSTGSIRTPEASSAHTNSSRLNFPTATSPHGQAPNNNSLVPMEVKVTHIIPREHRSSRSKSSVLLKSLSNPRTRTPRTYSNSPTSEPVISPVRQLAPLSRYNPFTRARAESLSSVIDAETIRPRPRRNSTVSGLFGKKSRKAEVAGFGL